MPRGKALAVHLKKWARMPRKAAEDQMGASGPTWTIPGRWRVLAGSLAEEWRMAWSNVSRALSPLGQVVRASLSQAGWAQRSHFPDLSWWMRAAENLSSPINRWGLSKGGYGYLAGSSAAFSYCSMRRLLHWSFS